MSIFSTVIKEAGKDLLVGTTLVGGATLGGVTIDAIRNPEIGDTKDYSDVISNSSNFGLDLAYAYLGIKYGVKSYGLAKNMLAKKGNFSPPNTSGSQFAIDSFTTGEQVIK